MVEIFMKFYFHFYLLLLLSGKFVLCVPVEYDVGNESYDLDTEQSEARYDPRLLSEELRGTHTEAQQGAEACISSELRYEHGQKISRTDPCEVCLCVDGEVFCWWKQCESNQLQTIKSSSSDITSILQSSSSSVQTTRKTSSSSHNRNNKIQSQTKSTTGGGGGTKSKYTKYQQSNKNKNKYLNTNYTRKNVNNFPKGILSFPINLPLHIPLSDLDGQQRHHQQQNNNSDDSYNTHSRDENEITTTITENFETTTIQPTATTSGIAPTTTPNEITSTMVVMNETVNTGGTSNSDDDDEYNELQMKHIKIDDITTGQHYVITSSGNVENDDLNLDSNVLASDSVISQFNGNKHFMDTPTVFTTTSSILPSFPLGISTSSEITSSSSSNVTTELSLNSVNSNNKLIVNSFNKVNNIYNNNNSHNSDNSNISSITTDDNPTDYDVIIGNVTTTTTTTIQDGLLQSSSPSLVAGAGNGDGTTTQITTTTTNIVTTEVPREENCIVMGITYKVGTILPQETGNCLQCICIEGANPTIDPPRVTCNPHNCPPLILPDLFDTTGY